MVHRDTRARRQVSLLLLTLLLTLLPPALPPRPAAAQPSAVCADLTAVPADECQALVAIYEATAGADWVARTSWLSPSANGPCDWFGVICADGHVTQLALPRNRLTGPFPRSLGDLPELARLNLSGNRLRGPVPPVACALAARGVEARLGFNALLSPRLDIARCLDRLDAAWGATQTAPPRELRAAAIGADGVALAWAPIAYTADGGGYEVAFATAPEGPFTVHGAAAGKGASGYRVGGLSAGTSYILRVRSFTPPHSGNPSELVSDPVTIAVVTLGGGRTLLIVYFSADNDLAPNVPTVEERLRAGSARNPGAQVVLLSDGVGADDTRVVTIAGGQITPTDAVFTRWGVRELNTADPAVLAWFLRYARESFPSERELVALMGHGVALVPEITWPAAANARRGAPDGSVIPPLPKGIDATPADITDRGYLSTPALGAALAEATDDGANPFDILFFDQCFQGNLDTLYEVRGAAEIFIASPNYAWLAAPYDEYLALLAPSSSLDAIADGIIARYERSLDNSHPNVIFWLRRADIDAAAAAVSALGAALQRAVAAGERAGIAASVGESQYVDTTQCGRQNMRLGPPDELIGAGAFAERLQTAFPAGDSFGVNAAAGQVLAALDPIRSIARVGAPYIAPDERWNYTDTLTILAPLSPALPSSVSWRSSIYTETLPLAPAWTPVPTMTISIGTSFAYVRDGGWDEFLAAWYGAPRTPTVGEWCTYTPPALVPGAEPEALGLSGRLRTNTTLRLSWSAATDADAAAYWVYARRPGDIAWITVARLPLTQAFYELPTPPGAYQFTVAAQDAAGLTVARSNELAYTQPAEVRWRALLPLLRR